MAHIDQTTNYQGTSMQITLTPPADPLLIDESGAPVTHNYSAHNPMNRSVTIIGGVADLSGPSNEVTVGDVTVRAGSNMSNAVQTVTLPASFTLAPFETKDYPVTVECDNTLNNGSNFNIKLTASDL